VDASYITLGVVLIQLGEGEHDHPITFVSRKLSKVEKNYSTKNSEGLAMVYVLPKFLTLTVGHTLQNVHRSFHSQIPSQKACVGGDDLLVAIDFSII